MSASTTDLATAAEPTPSSSAEDWQTEWFAVLPELEQLARQRKRAPDAVVMRASQLDALRLDGELTAMLREQFLKVFAQFQPRIISALQPELTLLLDFLVFRFSVWSGKPTPGSALMNLRYRNERSSNSPATTASSGGTEPSSSQPLTDARQGGAQTGVEGPGLTRWQRGLYGAGTVFLRYAWARAEHAAIAQHWGDWPEAHWSWRAWQLLRGVETGYKLLSLLNFLAFLRHGKYRSLLERVLCARLVYQRSTMARAISFEYLNRQLVWHELSELLLFVLPLVNVARIRGLVKYWLPNLAPAPDRTGALLPLGEAGNRAAQRQPCSFCYTADVLTPYTALPCRHLFCYYCLRSQCEADIDFRCPQCQERVMAMRRLQPQLPT